MYKLHKKFLKVNLKYFLLFVVCALAGFAFVRFSGNVGQVSANGVAEDTQKIFEVCQKSSELERCYGDKFGELGRKKEIEHTMAVFHNLQSVDPSTLSCHFIAHRISQAEVGKNPAKWLDVMEKLDLNGCSRGFFHGAIEGYLQYDPEFKLNKVSIIDICGKVSKKTNSNMSVAQTRSMCLHTVGHMVLVQTEGVVNNGIEICSQLPEYFQLDCFDGVFMENANRENLQMHNLADDLDWNEENTFQIERLCKKYSGKAGIACWNGLAEMYGSISNGNSLRLYGLCKAVPEIIERENCYAKGSGFMAFMISSGKLSPTGGTASLCQQTIESGRLMNKCIQNVISYILNSSTSYGKHVLVFCEGLPESKIDFCYRESIQILSTHPRNVLEDFCLQAPVSRREACLDKISS